jgi:glucan 1,3-beta-glucosidase
LQSITGGFVGIEFAGQQCAFKSIKFKYCTTALKVTGGYSVLVQNANFDMVGTCTDIMSAGGFGSLTVLDCTVNSAGPAVKMQAWQQAIVQNLKTSGSSNPVATDGNSTFLGAQSHVDTWIKGNVYPGGSQSGMSASTTPPSVLLDSDGKFFTKAQPTYQDISAHDVVNVKGVSGHFVAGDGKQDDTDSLNAILASNAASNKISYFPGGVYLVGGNSPLKIPPGSRIVGEAWPTLTGHSNSGSDPANPHPIVQIGQKGDIGVCEISEMRFSVSEILPGAKIIEVNMAGHSPGDVGIWNSLITVGGTREFRPMNEVGNQDVSNSRAAFVTIHLTDTSSTYIENLWSWSADHYLDGGNGFPGAGLQIISCGRGLLCEATKGTWLTGTGFEHHWLYQYNFHHASNVFAGMLQTETPYMQGQGAVNTVPAPWKADSTYGDPDFHWVGGGDQTGRVALAVNVAGGSDIYLYNGAHWAFFTGPWRGDYVHRKQTVQTDMVRVSGSPKRFTYYGLNTKAAVRLINDGQGSDQGPLQSKFPGGWGEAAGMNGGQLIAYRTCA